MSLVVYKYPLAIEDRLTIRMPYGAQLLHVEVQDQTPCLWALVDPSRALECRNFRMAGTCHEITEKVEHVGSFLICGDAMVFHLFEVQP